MSVYKEARYIMRDLGKRQQRIFSDACDFGVPIKSETDPVFAMVKQLQDMYFSAEEGDTRTVVNFGIGTTVTVKMNFMDEWNTGKLVPCVISYTRQPQKRTLHGAIVGILSVDCEWAQS